MSAIPDHRAISRFVEASKFGGLGSTGASMVASPGKLYNVHLSTDDPKHVSGHGGLTWKDLLIALGYFTSSSTCNITNSGASGTHNNFSVGGHMTVNSNNTVTHGTCYLMPECYWHNSSSRDNIQYSHSNAQVAKLTGYMQGEHVVTFKLRMPTHMPFAFLFEKDGMWDYRDLSAAEAKNVEKMAVDIGCKHYALIERVPNGDETLHLVREDNIPIHA